jgi:hypothetical protein
MPSGSRLPAQVAAGSRALRASPAFAEGSSIGRSWLLGERAGLPASPSPSRPLARFALLVAGGACRQDRRAARGLSLAFQVPRRFEPLVAASRGRECRRDQRPAREPVRASGFSPAAPCPSRPPAQFEPLVAKRASAVGIEEPRVARARSRVRQHGAFVDLGPNHDARLAAGAASAGASTFPFHHILKRRPELLHHSLGYHHYAIVPDAFWIAMVPEPLVPALTLLTDLWVRYNKSMA